MHKVPLCPKCGEPAYQVLRTKAYHRVLSIKANECPDGDYEVTTVLPPEPERELEDESLFECINHKCPVTTIEPRELVLKDEEGEVSAAPQATCCGCGRVLSDDEANGEVCEVCGEMIHIGDEDDE